MKTVGSRLISSTLTGSSPPKPIQTPPHPPPSKQQSLLKINSPPRRNVILLSLLSLLPPLSQPIPVSAFSIGISGPKDWLREQKKKASRFLLAPIDASRDSLLAANRMLTEGVSDDSTKDLGEIQRLLKSASRDCILNNRNSFVSFQASTGVEVCTFTLIVKNAASLLGNKDPVKLEAEAMLSDLIRSFTSLDGMANEADLQLASSRTKVANALTDTISSLDKFEQGIKDCLEELRREMDKNFVPASYRR